MFAPEWTSDFHYEWFKQRRIVSAHCDVTKWRRSTHCHQPKVSFLESVPDDWKHEWRRKWARYNTKMYLHHVCKLGGAIKGELHHVLPSITYFFYNLSALKLKYFETYFRDHWHRSWVTVRSGNHSFSIDNSKNVRSFNLRWSAHETPIVFRRWLLESCWMQMLHTSKKWAVCNRKAGP